MEYIAILSDNGVGINITKKEYSDLLFETKTFVHGSCLTLSQIDKIYQTKQILAWEKKQLLDDTTKEN